MTPARRSATAGSSYAGVPKRNGTYVVCLDCGKEFDYNWKEMRVGTGTDSTPKPAVAETLSVVNR